MRKRFSIEEPTFPPLSKLLCAATNFLLSSLPLWVSSSEAGGGLSQDRSGIHRVSEYLEVGAGQHCLGWEWGLNTMYCYQGAGACP